MKQIDLEEVEVGYFRAECPYCCYSYSTYDSLKAESKVEEHILSQHHAEVN